MKRRGAAQLREKLMALSYVERAVYWRKRSEEFHEWIVKLKSEAAREKRRSNAFQCQV
jgi:hypothetical protein